MKILESYNGLSSKIVEKSDYDGIWVSSLTDSASRGLPDIELVSPSDRIERIREIRDASTKPIIVDWDTGGQVDHFPYWAKKLEEAGVSAIVIEDKAFPKRNSLLEDTKHNLEDVDKFCEKIREGKKALKNTIIIARLESLIAKHSVYEALIRAEAFIEAGADGILIHSKQKVSAEEIMEFADKFREKWDIPLVAVPTTYKLPNKHPFDIIINANHLLRASLKAMEETAKSIDEEKLAPVTDIFKLLENEDRSTR